MKMSRFSFLFAIMLFVAPITVIAEDNSTNKETSTEQQPAQDKTTIATKAGIIATITGAFTKLYGKVDKGLLVVESYSFKLALDQIAKIKYLKGWKFEQNIPTISRTLTAATIVAITYAAYKAYTAEQQEELADEFNNDDLYTIEN